MGCIESRPSFRALQKGRPNRIVSGDQDPTLEQRHHHVPVSVQQPIPRTGVLPQQTAAVQRIAAQDVSLSGPGHGAVGVHGPSAGRVR